jgi:radical SAM protein with 4Fe4S-binding SPASM domain
VSQAERADFPYIPVAPFHVVWLATNGCNARCLHCSSNSARQTSDELSTTEVLSLIDDLADFGVVDFGVSGGEPLLRRDLYPVLAHATARGLAVGVGSNGANLNERAARSLAESGVTRFQVSLDGGRAAHEALRRWPGLFTRVLRAIQVAQSVGLRVHVCCTVNRLNVHELESFAELTAGLGVARLNFSRYVPTGRGSAALDLANVEWQLVIRRCSALRSKYKGCMDIVGHLAQQILVNDEVRHLPSFIGCQAGIGQACVTANGTVLPCVLLPVPVGNIRRGSFAAIWRDSPTLRALRDRNALSGRCGRCAVRARCGGCRAVAYARTGDYLAEDPRCWLGEPAERN